jgi:predicted small lipoprotein YifL
MTTLSKLLAILALAACLSACGVRGDPEPPAYTQQ